MKGEKINKETTREKQSGNRSLFFVQACPFGRFVSCFRRAKEEWWRLSSGRLLSVWCHDRWISSNFLEFSRRSATVASGWCWTHKSKYWIKCAPCRLFKLAPSLFCSKRISGCRMLFCLLKKRKNIVWIFNKLSVVNIFIHFWIWCRCNWISK